MMKEHSRIVSDNVRSWRARHGYNQEELAKRCGMRQTSISRIENSAELGRTIRLSTIERLARAMDVDVADLLRDSAG
jgi:transcriptional regulator with XRE-family HTH domain